jgi:preprotein translocase subunit SecF
MENNKNWLYVGLAALTIIGIIGFSFLSNPNIDRQTQSSVGQTQNQTVVEQPATSADIDALLNDLDFQENQVNQSLSDQPVDVLSDD